MAYASGRSLLTEPKEKVWSILLDYVSHPEKYLSPVVEVTVTESEESVMRTLSTRHFSWQEEAIPSPKHHQISFHLHHPELSGTTTFKLVTDPYQGTEGTYIEGQLDWQSKGDPLPSEVVLELSQTLLRGPLAAMKRQSVKDF